MYNKQAEEMRMIRYTHVNIIAKNSEKIASFYKNVFGCQAVGAPKDLRGEWLDRLVGVPNAHITGELLRLPGYEDRSPELEIFSYDEMLPGECAVNRCGLSHLAFEVDDVEATLARILENGGSQIGEVVTRENANGGKTVLVYAADCEGNILELQRFC